MLIQNLNYFVNFLEKWGMGNIHIKSESKPFIGNKHELYIYKRNVIYSSLTNENVN